MYTSIAVWPADAGLCLGNSSNESRDTHPTFGHAAAVCRLLRERGFGGDGVIFPVSTHVEGPDGKRISGTVEALTGELTQVEGYRKTYTSDATRTGEQDAEPLSRMTRTYKVENTSADDPDCNGKPVTWDYPPRFGKVRGKHNGRNGGAFGGRSKAAR